MSDLKVRLMADISGTALCTKPEISRSRLSLIERGHVLPDAEDAFRINTSLDNLIQAPAVIDQVAASMGGFTEVRHDQ
jgi:hypothetical protein